MVTDPERHINMDLDPTLILKKICGYITGSKLSIFLLSTIDIAHVSYSSCLKKR
jgi:hypothetical protein